MPERRRGLTKPHTSHLLSPHLLWIMEGLHSARLLLSVTESGFSVSPTELGLRTEYSFVVKLEMVHAADFSRVPHEEAMSAFLSPPSFPTYPSFPFLVQRSAALLKHRWSWRTSDPVHRYLKLTSCQEQMSAIRHNYRGYNHSRGATGWMVPCPPSPEIKL